MRIAPDGLVGDDAAGDEAAPVADAVDLEADRLVVVAAADEVGTQRVHRQLGIHRVGRGAQCLGDDLAAVQAAPGVLRAVADIGVGAALVQLEQRDCGHGVAAYDGEASDDSANSLNSAAPTASAPSVVKCSPSRRTSRSDPSARRTGSGSNTR